MNENQDLEIGIQSANTIFQDDMSDGIVDSFYTINSNNRTTEQSGYLQTSQVATDQQSSMYSQWFSTSEDVLTIEYDFYSHP